MKKMTLFTFVMSSFIMLSCSTEEKPLQEDLIAISAKSLAEQDYDYLNGIQMYYSSAEAEIENLKIQKIKLVAELENGNKKVMEQIENIQKKIEKLTRFNEYLFLLKPPKGLKPIPRPKPCLSTKNNCYPVQKISPKSFILLGNDLMVTNVTIKNQKNEIVGRSGSLKKDDFDQNILSLESKLNGEGVMYTTLKTKVVGEITIPTPVTSL